MMTGGVSCGLSKLKGVFSVLASLTKGGLNSGTKALAIESRHSSQRGIARNDEDADAASPAHETL